MMMSEQYAVKNYKKYYLKSDFLKKAEDPNICDVCNKVVCNLKYIKTNFGEKTFKCNYCNNLYYSKNCLTLHKLIHRGKQAHACDKCDKLFWTKTLLRRHYYIHTGEKRYSCKLCDVKFIQLIQLQRHNRKFHNENSKHKKNSDLTGTQSYQNIEVIQFADSLMDEIKEEILSDMEENLDESEQDEQDSKVLLASIIV